MPLPTKLYVFYLNLWRKKSFLDNMKYMLEYLANMERFLERFCWERYMLKVDVQYYQPYYTPNSYKDLQEWERKSWVHGNFGDQLQLYCGYGLRLKPHEVDSTVGYCECHKFTGQLKPEDMMYADMPEYFTSAVVPSIYHAFADFSRVGTHELEHQILRLLGDRRWITGVHKAKLQPLVKWDMGYRDSRGKQVVFYSQVDPRTV